MKAASLKEIKAELSHYTTEQLLGLCLTLAKFKKENKELLSYQLFEAHDEITYLNKSKALLDEAFEQLNTNNLYFAKKNLRKIIRTANRFAKYSDDSSTEIYLLLHICQKIIASGLPVHKSQQLINLFQGLVKKIRVAISQLHEDLQHDFNKELQKVSTAI